MYNIIEKGVWLDHFLVLVHQEVFGDCALEAGIESRDLMKGLACITSLYSCEQLKPRA